MDKLSNVRLGLHVVTFIMKYRICDVGSFNIVVNKILLLAAEHYQERSARYIFCEHADPYQRFNDIEPPC